MQENYIKYQSEALDDFLNYLKEGNFSKVFFLTDENTHEHCLPLLLREIEDIPPMEILEIEAGEESKSPEILFQLWLSLSELEADRHSLLVNVGGGVVCDLGGFLAGTYMRGISFVNFPTSLLAQVDASAGGKTGINLNGVKNQLGLFLAADRVYIINDFLETLSSRELRSGFAEMLKHALIADEDYWKQLRDFNLEENIPDTEMIKHSVEIKSKITGRDFKEDGLRKTLNFGHSIGHAVESASHKDKKVLLHGEAIALGMMCELQLSVKYANLDEIIAADIIKHLKSVYKDVKFPADEETILNFIKKDKKNNAGIYNFSLIENIGSAKYDIAVSEESIVNVIRLFSR